MLPKWYEKSDPSWFGFPLTIKDESNISRIELLKHYEENLIGTRLLFGGNIGLQPAYENIDLGDTNDFPEANKVANNTFWLGVYPGLNNDMLDFMVEKTKDFITKK